MAASSKALSIATAVLPGQLQFFQGAGKLLHDTAASSHCRYNSIMKMIFIGSTLAIIYQMRYNRSIKATYDAERDTFKSEFLIGGAVLLAFILHEPIKRPGTMHFLVQVRLLRPRGNPPCRIVGTYTCGVSPRTVAYVPVCTIRCSQLVYWAIFPASLAAAMSSGPCYGTVVLCLCRS
jgi:ER lumen protein retaining receptor